MKRCAFGWPARVFCAAFLVAAAAGAGLADEGKVDAATKKLMAAGGFFQRGMYDLAVQEYEEFLLQYPEHGEATAARYGLAVCYYRLNRYGEAVAQLQDVVKEAKFKQRDEALVVLGHCQLMEKKYDQALAACDDLLAKFPKSRHAEVAAMYRVQALYQLNRAQDARKACQDFLDKYPDSPRRTGAVYFLACAQEALGEHAEAAATIEKLMAKPVESQYVPDAALLWGQALENQDQFAAAAEKYRAFLKAAPEDRKDQGHYSLGLVLYKAAQYDEAIKELAMVVSKHEGGPYAGPARLQLGLAQLAGNKASDARKTLEAVVKADPQRADRARYWLAQCDMAEGKYADARSKLDDLARAKADNLDAVLYDRAICAMETEQFEQAAKEFGDFRAQYGSSKQAPDATYRQAFCLHKLGRYDESQKLCDEAAGAADARVAAAAAELAAENLFLMENYAEAAQRFEKLIPSARAAKDESKALRFSFRLGQCAFLTGQYPKAVQLLEPVAARPAATADKHLREALFFLADAQFQAEQFTAAAQSFAKYLAAEPTRKEEAQFKLGLAQLRAKQVPAAEKTLGAMAAGEMKSPWELRAAFAYGQMAYHQLKKPDKAAEALRKVLAAKDAPEDILAPTIYLLASIEFDAEKYPAAAAGFGEVVKRFGKHELAGDAALQQAICVKEMGKGDEAIRLLDAFLKEYPKSPRAGEARHLKGTCLAKAGRNEEAVRVFSALADETGARNESVLYELAWAQRAPKDTGAAAATYRRLLEQFPKGKLVAPARTELAELLYLDKKYAEAAALLEQVVADKSVDAKTMAVAQYRLGWCYAELSKPREAAEIFAKFAQSYPSDALAASAIYQAGVAQMQADNNAEAAKTLEELLAKFPDHEVAPVARLKLGEAQATAGEFEASAATYQAFLQKYPDNEFAYLARFGVGWAMENQKKYDEARAWYSQVTAGHNGPTAARAQFQIGECYFAQGNFQRAARELLNVDIVYAYPEWSAGALYEAGRAFEQLGSMDQAKAQYELCVNKYGKQDAAALAGRRLKEIEAARKP